MNISDPNATVKSINRYIRKNHIFEGGKSFGVDYVTWHICYPQIADVVNKCGKILTGKEANYFPIAILE